jgi:imidazole glycerol phosphate synthase subunit HisF
MPVGYGGGIHDLNQIEKLFKLGLEKIVLNTAAYIHPQPPETIWDVPGLEAYHGKDIHLTEALTLEAIQAVHEVSNAERSGMRKW